MLIEYEPLEEQQRKLREKYLPNELRLRKLTKYVDAVNPRAMEQLVIFMCWFNPKIGKEHKDDLMRIIQQVRMTNNLPVNAKKLQAILMSSTNLFKKSHICAILHIAPATLNRWLEETEALNVKALNFSTADYDLMFLFMQSFDKLCRARNLLKGTL